MGPDSARTRLRTHRTAHLLPANASYNHRTAATHAVVPLLTPFCYRYAATPTRAFTPYRLPRAGICADAHRATTCPTVLADQLEHLGLPRAPATRCAPRARLTLGAHYLALV